MRHPLAAILDILRAEDERELVRLDAKFPPYGSAIHGTMDFQIESVGDDGKLGVRRPDAALLGELT